jgi:outer membrane protein TolC
MNIKKIWLATFLTISIAAPLRAETKWVEEFLRRYQPSASTSDSKETTPIAEMLQTGTIPIGVNDLVNMMLDQNLDIRSNRFSPRSSYYQSLVFYRALQPSLRLSTNLSSNTTASTSQLNGVGQDTITTKRRNYTIGFAQALAYGTSISVDATLDRQASNGNVNNYNPSYTSRITYTIGQKLLRDRGHLPNTRQIMQGENNQKISETNFEIQITNLIAQAQKAYWDLVFAGEDLKVKQRSLELAQRTLDENQMKVDIGTLAPIELTLNRSDVANRRDAMLTSTFSVTTAEDQIKKLVSSDKSPQMFLLKFAAKDAPRDASTISVPTLEGAVRTALENRPEMRNATLDLKNKQIDEKYTANQKLPQFDVTASYNQNGVGGTLFKRSTIGGGASEIIPGGVLDSFHQLFTYNYSGYSVGFTFNMPMSFSTWKPWQFFKSPAANADHDRAVTERQLSEARMNATAQSIMLEVRNALTQVEQNRARIETAQVALDLARQRLDAEQTKFNLGTSTLRFVLEEQRNVAQAETSELQTRVNLTKALIDLDKATGMTLRNNNIEVEKALQSSSMSDYKPANVSLAPAANQK